MAVTLSLWLLRPLPQVASDEYEIWRDGPPDTLTTCTNATPAQSGPASIRVQAVNPVGLGSAG